MSRIKIGVLPKRIATTYTPESYLAETFSLLNIVTIGNSVYMSVADSNVGQPLSDGNYWVCLVDGNARQQAIDAAQAAQEEADRLRDQEAEVVAEALASLTAIVPVSSGTTDLTIRENRFYHVAGDVDTLNVVIATPTDTGHVQIYQLRLKTGTTPAITFTAQDGSTILYPEWYELDPSTEYEFSLLYDGSNYLLRYANYE